tara:strand:+ start:4637 stop:4969 length:333 start_codon:yes stop_codon:yes gene_type:complete
MKKVVRLTESELVRIIENLTLGHEPEGKRESSSMEDHIESKRADANPVAKKAFNDVVGHLEATKGAFSLRNKSTTENLEDDKLNKKWKWKTNDGKVNVTVSVDVSMNDKK